MSPLRYAGASARGKRKTMSSAESAASRYAARGFSIGLVGLGVVGVAALVELPRILDLGIALGVIGGAIQVIASGGLGFLEGWRSKRDGRDDGSR